MADDDHGWILSNLWGCNCAFCGRNLSVFGELKSSTVSDHKKVCPNFPLGKLTYTNHDIKRANAVHLMCRKFNVENIGFKPSEVTWNWFCANPTCKRNVVPFDKKSNANRHVTQRRKEGCNGTLKLEAYVEKGVKNHGGRSVKRWENLTLLVCLREAFTF